MMGKAQQVTLITTKTALITVLLQLNKTYASHHLNCQINHE